MTKDCKENRPLLIDEPSDEEHVLQSCDHNSYFRHLRSSRGRSKNKIKGASYIMSRWSDPCPSKSGYWGFGIIILCLLIFVVYNGVLATSLSSPYQLRHYRTEKIKYQSEIENSIIFSETPEVFMHIYVVKPAEDFNNYFPYIDKMAKKFPKIKFNFLVMINDTNHEPLYFKSAAQINDDVLNSLILDDKLREKSVGSVHNIDIYHVSLMKYLDESPFVKRWRHLPAHFIPFMVRAVSIWDKGGISFNPDILQPYLFNKLQADKLDKTFEKYYHQSPVVDEEENVHIADNKRVNNIRDIIESLSRNDGNTNILFQTNLTEDENRITKTYKINNEDRFSVAANTKNGIDKLLDINHLDNLTTKSMRKSYDQNYKLKSYASKQDRIEMSTMQAITHKLIDQLSNKEVPDKSTSANLKRFYAKSKTVNKKDPKLNTDTITTSASEHIRLAIDIRGNIIAASTPCHAFIGSLFSNSYHYTDDQSITDFIISELTLFSNGHPSTYNDIDII